MYVCNKIVYIYIYVCVIAMLNIMGFSSKISSVCTTKVVITIFAFKINTMLPFAPTLIVNGVQTVP